MKDKIFPFLSLVVSCAYASEKPNLIVIQTDEHTINTLGCYRRLVGDINDSPWGKNVVQTPNIDRQKKEPSVPGIMLHLLFLLLQEHLSRQDFILYLQDVRLTICL